jgi:hypothetical protein
MTTPGLFAISGLLVLALVSGLLFSKIQRQRLLTDLGLLRARWSARPCTLDPVYTATNGSLLTVKQRVKLRSTSARVGCSFSLRLFPQG